MYDENEKKIDVNEEIIEENKPEKKKWTKIIKPVAISLVSVCLAGGIFYMASMGAEKFASFSEGEIETTKEALEKTDEGKAEEKKDNTKIETTKGAITLSYSDEEVKEMSIETIVDACLPSVVSITNKGVAEVMTFFGNYQTESISSGSGIIIGENDTELLIVTNYHVVADSKELTVVFSHEETADSEDINIAKVKGYDEDKDIAVIAVELDELSDETRGKIRIATVGNSDEIKLGGGVVAIGNALGYGQSVTHGIISALNREVTMRGVNGGTITNAYIQTDAAINSGNSGGALLNMKGELIGINSAKISAEGVEGMGYAIPITDVEELISNLMALKTRDVVEEDKRGYLGIYGTDVTSSASQAYGMPVGIFLQDIVENSPAEKAGLEDGDIITKIDGVSVTTMVSLQERLSYYEKGEVIVINVKRVESREYVDKEIKVTLGSKKDAGVE